jgi:hypothetical protein
MRSTLASFAACALLSVAGNHAAAGVHVTLKG